MFDEEFLKKGLKMLTEIPNLASLIDKMGFMPNINFPTMGGTVFWNDLAEENSWRVQRHSITGHCRILDNEDVRRAWGSESAIMDFFRKIVK